jgi:hypothetical protein
MPRELTPTEAFVAKRVKDKIGSLLHHFKDAIEAARLLSGDVHQSHEFPRAVEVLEAKVAELRSIVGKREVPGA